MIHLPAPIHAKIINYNDSKGAVARSTSGPSKATGVPSYEQRCDSASRLVSLPIDMQKIEREKNPLFVPRSLADFEDGGSFPEIHVGQYPRHMGNPHLSGGRSIISSKTDVSSIPGSSLTASAIINANIDASGRKDYTSLVTSGTNAEKIVYAKHSDLRGNSNPLASDIALPSAEEEAVTSEKTAQAVQARLASHVALAKPSGSAMINALTSKNQEENTQFIQYTPRPDAPGYNPVAAKRVIQMVPAQVDPMMPPKHRHVKAPRGPAEDPVPVLHAPPEKLTNEERMSWNVPACISNWKNPRGYTIPLDKRLAADGRGLRDDSTINSNFATLSESLYLAERQAREEVRLRSLVQKKQAEMERERRENELRELASRARMERSGFSTNKFSSEDASESVNIVQGIQNNSDDEGQFVSQREHDDGHVLVHKNRESNVDDVESEYTLQRSQARLRGDDNSESNFDDYEDIAAQQREKLRIARRRERDREFRTQGHSRANDENIAVKKARLEEDRDVSEKIALGVLTGTGSSGGVDSRLYNQSSGLDSGFGAEDDYNIFSKPMFDRHGVTSASIYRPTRGEGALDADEEYAKLAKGATSKFQPDKGFSGAEGGRIASGVRSAPVQFEKATQK